MAPPKSEWDKQMSHLDGEIRRLEAEFNMFLAGRLPRPPWETRTRVRALVKAQVSKFAGEGKSVNFRMGLKDGKVSLSVKADEAGE